MSDFTAGLAVRLDAAAQALHAAFALEAQPGFAAADVRDRRRAPRGFAAEPRSAEPPAPKSFSPADRDTNPTEGWDPFAAAAEGGHDFVDPIAAAHAAGFAEGVAAAVAEGRARDAEGALLLTRLAEALGAGPRLDRERLAEQLRGTVLLLVTKIVGEAGVSADLLAARVAAAAEVLADANESALLRLNPADVMLVDGKLPATIFAAGDAVVARGSFVLESASTIVEDGPSLWLEQLTAAVDKVAIPC